MAPSDLHRKLQAKFNVFLAARCTGRGVRSAREVRVDDGYVVDALGLCSFQYAELVEFCKHWNMVKRDSRLNIPEVDYDTLGHNYFSIAAEVKVSRSDFFNTFGGKNVTHANRLNPIADLHFVITPRGLVTPQEVPAFWGLLEQRGIGLTITKFPELTRQDSGVVARLAHIILWAQDGVRDALWQEIVNRERAEDEEYRKQKNINNTP